MIAIIDYGAGNIFSVKNALDYLGFENKLTDKKEDIEKADAIILPGVGAFPWAMNMLGLSGLIDTIKEQAKIKPFLGICLGMQLLFEKSYGVIRVITASILISICKIASSVPCRKNFFPDAVHMFQYNYFCPV